MFNTMSRYLSVTFSGTYLVRMKNEVVTPLKSKFYGRYVDGIFNRHNKNVVDILFKRLHNYQQDIKLII